MFTSLPDDIIVEILARVPRCNYPALSLVSKHFRSVVVSPEIYARRSLLGCTEACLYGYLYNTKTHNYGFYIFSRKANNSNRFVLIPSLSVVPSIKCQVSVGSMIYVFGNHMNSNLFGNHMDSNLFGNHMNAHFFAIDCRFHTVQPLPKMPIPMEGIVANVIDEKIYIIGDVTNEELNNVVLVFNTKTQMWEDSKVIKREDSLRSCYYCSSVVIANKMYMMSLRDGFVYEPKENKLETDEMLNSKNWRDPCVIDDVMYYYDIENVLRAYDTKIKCWSVVKGVREFVLEGLTPYCSNTLNYGGKLVVLTPIKTRKILFMEIAIERRQGEIWGKVECFDVLGEANMSFRKPFVVMV